MTKRSNAELREEMLDQIAAFRHSSASYDQGNEWEYKRLATSIYILVFDGVGSRSRSLLGMLGIKSSMKFLTTYSQPYVSLEDRRRGVTSTWVGLSPLVGVQFGPNPKYYPLMAHSGGATWTSFGKWWEECVFSNVEALPLSRKNLIFTARTQDGGAHVDRKITSIDYQKVKSGSAGDMTFTSGRLDQDMSEWTVHTVTNGVSALVRQIAWELDQSLALLDL